MSGGYTEAARRRYLRYYAKRGEEIRARARLKYRSMFGGKLKRELNKLTAHERMETKHVTYTVPNR